MPKYPRPNKNFPAKSGTKSHRAAGRAISVNELLAKAGIGGKQILQGSVKHQAWREFIAGLLAADIAPHLHSVVEQPRGLALHVDHAVWAARLKYALEDLRPVLEERAGRSLELVVRVLPGEPALSRPPR
jgi:hypothetical protein